MTTEEQQYVGANADLNTTASRLGRQEVAAREGDE